MRVLHLTRDFPPKACGGVSTAVGGLVAALTRAGVTCAVASFDGWRPARRAGDPVREPSRQDLDGLAVLRLEPPASPHALMPFSKEFRPDLLHVHEALLWDQADGADPTGSIPRLLTVHVYQRELNRLRELGQTLSGQAEDRALNRADAISAPSAWVADRLGRDHPDLTRRIKVAGWGVESGLPAPTRPQPGNRALYVGRFGDAKGTPELAEVVRRVLAASPATRFIIAGGLPHNRHAERRWRERLTADLSGGDRERVSLPGWLLGAELEACYAKASVAVVPSRFETFGLTALEAMARGLPVVATRAGGLPELIEHDQNGLLSDPGDAAGLAAHLTGLLANPEMATALGDEARRRVMARHRWEQRIADWLEIYGAL